MSGNNKISIDMLLHNSDGSVRTLDHLKTCFIQARALYNAQPHRDNPFKRGSAALFNQSHRPYKKMLDGITIAIKHRDAPDSITADEKAVLYSLGVLSILDPEYRLTEPLQIAKMISKFFDVTYAAGGNDEKSYKFILSHVLIKNDHGFSDKTNSSDAESLCKTIKSTVDTYLENNAGEESTNRLQGLFENISSKTLLEAMDKAEEKYYKQGHISILSEDLYDAKKSVKHFRKFITLVHDSVYDPKSFRMYNAYLDEADDKTKCHSILGYYFYQNTPGGTDVKSLKMHVVCQLLDIDITQLKSDAAISVVERLYMAFSQAVVKVSGYAIDQDVFKRNHSRFSLAPGKK